MKFLPLLLLPACALPLFLLNAQDRKRDLLSENPPNASDYSAETRLIFFAVLEGLYQDGVNGEALELLNPGETEMWVKDQPDRTNFVYTCPICMPTFDALRLYQSRKRFYGQKGTRYSTFGQGLSESVLKQLKGSPQERRDAIQLLIQRWVGQRLDGMSLSKTERGEIEDRLKEMKKDGEEALKRFQKNAHGSTFTEHYKGWKKCPACDGASAMGGTE
jgi:hypothetical protein